MLAFRLLHVLERNAKRLIGVTRETLPKQRKTANFVARRWCPRPLNFNFFYAFSSEMQKGQPGRAVKHCKTLVKARNLLDFLASLEPIGLCKFAAGTPPCPLIKR